MGTRVILIFRMIRILLFIIMISFLSCESKKDECRYVPNNSPTDNSLFISYTINNIEYRFFEFYKESSTLSYKNTFLMLNGQYICRTTYPFFFGDLNSNKFQVTLNFHDTTLQGEMFHQRALRKRLNTNYKFSVPKQEPMDSKLIIGDTIFLRGVSLSINNNEYSTENLFSYYDFNIDSINKYLWDDSYFRITKNESACGWDRLIEGEFSTLIMKNGENKHTKVENGRFRILIFI